MATPSAAAVRQPSRVKRGNRELPAELAVLGFVVVAAGDGGPCVGNAHEGFGDCAPANDKYGTTQYCTGCGLTIGIPKSALAN